MISVRSNFVTAEGASPSHEAEGGVKKNSHAYMQEALDMVGVLGINPTRPLFKSDSQLIALSTDREPSIFLFTNATASREFNSKTV